MTKIIELSERTAKGRKYATDKTRAAMWSPDARQPPAITKPGERWHLNGFNLSTIIVVRDGPDDNGQTYVDGRHQYTIARFDTVRDAAAAVQAFNCFGIIADMWNDDLSPRDFHDRVGELLAVYGRVTA